MFRKSSFSIGLICILLVKAVAAQTTAFTYQGRLNDGGNPANGNYDMQFRLFDNSSVGQGTQQGATITNPTVSVSSGAFAVSLDFGAPVFASGADRYLEVSIRPAGSSGAYTTLAPRQKLTSSPYSVRSNSSNSADGLSNACAGCVQSSQINSLDGNKVTGPVANSTNAGNANNLGGLPIQRFVKFELDGTVSIGTTGTGSTLTVGGVIESTVGGIKFPDGSQQTTAGLATVTTNATLTGDGTSTAPLGISSPLLIRDLDNPTRQRFQASLDPGSNDVSVVTVAQDKTLVLEFFSGFVTKSSSVSSATLVLKIYENGVFANFNHFFFLKPYGLEGCCMTFNFAEPIRMYIGPGQELRVAFDTNTLTKKVNFTGHFVDAFPSSLRSGDKTNVQKK